MLNVKSLTFTLNLLYPWCWCLCSSNIMRFCCYSIVFQSMYEVKPDVLYGFLIASGGSVMIRQSLLVFNMLGPPARWAIRFSGDPQWVYDLFVYSLCIICDGSLYPLEIKLLLLLLLEWLLPFIQIYTWLIRSIYLHEYVLILLRPGFDLGFY